MDVKCIRDGMNGIIADNFSEKAVFYVTHDGFTIVEDIMDWR